MSHPPGKPDRDLVNTARLTLLPLVDSATFNLAFWLAYTIMYACGSGVVWRTYLELAPYAWLAPPLIFYFAGLYRSWDEFAFAKGIGSILWGVAGSMLMLLGIIWLIRDDLRALHEFQSGRVPPGGARELVWGFPVRVLALVMPLATTLLWLWRLAANEIERRLVGVSALPRRALIVGSMPRQDVARLGDNRRPRYQLLGCLTDTTAPSSPAPGDGALPRLGPPAHLGALIQELRAEEVFIMADDFPRERLLDLQETCFALGARPRLVLGVYDALICASSTSLQGEIPVCRFRSGGIQGWDLVGKRLLDVCISLLVLAVSAPLLLLPACVAIVIESKGWPVFSQTRVGLRGRRFQVYKLRTMVVDASHVGGPLTRDADPRITRVGRFLRKTSIDELPQFWNVLAGDMSVVGPRAVVPYVADRFEPWERLSLQVKPGITGLAQVSGRDEIGFREKSLLNLYYVRNHSLWLDLRIIFDTFGAVLSMEGTGGTRDEAAPPAAPGSAT